MLTTKPYRKRHGRCSQAFFFEILRGKPLGRDLLVEYTKEQQ